MGPVPPTERGTAARTWRGKSITMPAKELRKVSFHKEALIVVR